MEFKGTKGKWFVEWDGHYNEVKSTVNAYEGIIFRVSTLIHDCRGKYVVDLNNSEEDKANALLISKAPEMLEMLKKIYASISMQDEIEYCSKTYYDIEELINSATQIK